MKLGRRLRRLGLAAMPESLFAEEPLFARMINRRGEIRRA